MRALMRAIIVSAAMLATSYPATAQDARDVVAASSRAMGTDTLTGIRLFGSGSNFNLGQNNNANGPWPATPLNDYNRWIDFTTPASRATAVTFAAPVQGGPAVQGAFNQLVTPANTAWLQQLEIWITPWGFLKGAAQNAATVASRTIDGKAFRVVTWSPALKSPSGASYRVVGYIGPDNLVERVETWVENPIFGDMLVEADYTNYRDSNGLKYPTTMVQKRGGWPTFQAQILGVNANPADIRERMTPPAPATPPAAAPAAAAAAPQTGSDKLAEGVWRIRGGYNALAVEFRDYVVVFEPGPQNEARGAAIIAETKRVIPNKPIRYGVISHHHFDHSSGLPAVVAEGITIVTPEVNKAFLEKALSAPRTLSGDMLAKSGRKPIIEGFTGDKRVFDDGARTLEIHVIKGLPHADGLVVGWLPREKILVYADMFNLPTAANPVPNPPIVSTGVFLANIERLGLAPEQILSVHTLNPDRLATLRDIRASLGRE